MAQPEAGDIAFRLDGRAVTARAGETVWQVAHREGMTLPHVCLSTEPDFRPDGNCRLCLVEVEGRATLQASCILKPEPDMAVATEGDRVRRARALVMELVLCEARVEPMSETGAWGRSLGVTASRFAPPAAAPRPDDSHVGIAVDLGACVYCLRCVQACREVEVYDVIGMAERSTRCKIVFDLDDPMGTSTCVSCGSCAQACPTGAIRLRVPE